MKHTAIPFRECCYTLLVENITDTWPSKLRIRIDSVPPSFTHHRQHFCTSSAHFVLQRTALATSTTGVAYAAIATHATVCGYSLATALVRCILEAA